MTKERKKNINCLLEKLKDNSLRLHSDSITYQICILLQEIVDELDNYKTDCKNINDFVEYAKNEFDCDITIKKGEKLDTFESVFGESFSDNMEDSMIRAAIKARITKKQMIDIFYKDEENSNGGLMGIYKLGMKHMYEYLEDK